MLTNKDAIATIAVKDLESARLFYETTLGLRLEGPPDGEALTYKSGATKLIVYRSRFAGTNKATAANFAVGEDIGAIVAALKGKGVAFERYDWPGVVHEGDVHRAGDLKIAWFKDPEGNTLSLIST